MAASKSQHLSDLIEKLSKSELPKNSVLQPGFMKKDSLEPYAKGKRQLLRERRAERAKTKGKKWFNMPATEMTEERKNDLTVLQMRGALDPKRFYKKNELEVLPKYFQFGTVVETAADYYHSRIPKKQRKQTLVDELLADADFKRFRTKHQPPKETTSFKGKRQKRRRK